MPAMRIALLLLLVISSAAAVGCQGTRRETFEVSVVNEADAPVIAWLTKDGPPAEAGWLTPSQWLQLSEERSIPSDIPHPGLEIAPGMRADIGPHEGRLSAETSAVLLIYSTPVSLEEMAATPRRTSLMEIVYLVPGQNFIVVRSAAPVRAERVSRLERRPAGGESR